MVPTAFDQENLILDGPPGSTAEECGLLSVFRGHMDDGSPVVISCWKPTKAELEEINRTGRVWVLVLGSTMSPIHPTGHNPFER